MTTQQITIANAHSKTRADEIITKLSANLPRWESVVAAPAGGSFDIILRSSRKDITKTELFELACSFLVDCV